MIPAKGYAKETVTVSEQIAKLETYIETFPEMLRKLTADELVKRTADDKWSKKEITGHLVDSAINNLKRFTDAQFSSQPYKVINYQQVELVRANNYQNLPLDHLLDLWKALNKQIVFVVKEIPADKINYQVDPQYESRELKTLGWIISDYVAHMEHHFRQIFTSLDI